MKKYVMLTRIKEMLSPVKNWIVLHLYKYVWFEKEWYMRGDDKSRMALIDLITAVPGVAGAGIVMVEIGSYRGESAEIFLSTGRVSKIYCVDPWQMNYDPNDWAASTNMENVEKDFDRRFAGDERVVKVRGTIDTFVREYSDRGVVCDFVYVDGCHTYDAVKHDLKVTIDSVKPRFAVGGHDYNDCWKALKKAVEESVGFPDRTFEDTSWLKHL